MNPKSLHAYIPFHVSRELDPRKVYYVGDQMLLEHILGFHSRENLRDGYQDVLSRIEMNREAKEIRITPRKNLRFSNGQNISMQLICDSLRTSFKGTYHNPYAQHLKKIQCFDESILLSWNAIPNNILFLFTVPDLALFDPERLPVVDLKTPTAGPYQLIQSSQDQWHLKLNSYYPSELRANAINDLYFHSYVHQGGYSFFESMKPETHHLTYIYGQDFDEKAELLLKNKGFRLQTFPAEWLGFFEFPIKTALNDRKALVRLIQSQLFTKIFQKSKDSSLPVSPAWSVAPSDRPFGLKGPVLKAQKEDLLKFKNKHLFLTVSTTASESPFFKKILSLLKDHFKQITLEVHDEKPINHGREAFHLSYSTLGISPADPLVHLSYLRSTSTDVASFLSESDLNRVAVLKDFSAFAEEVQKLEIKIAESAAVIPLAHFPGVVAEAPFLKRDEALAWSWGFQAWTYRVDSLNP